MTEPNYISATEYYKKMFFTLSNYSLVSFSAKRNGFEYEKTDVTKARKYSK